MYRDLKPGAVGGDVAQLQNALSALGYSSGPDTPGQFGTGTKAAVTAFYNRLGYPVPTTGGSDDAGGKTAAIAGGPMVPAAEIVFAPTFPLHVEAFNGALGSTVAAPLLTVNSGSLMISSVLQPGQNAMVKPGMKVQLLAEGLDGQTATGTVTTVGTYNAGTQQSGAVPPAQGSAPSNGTVPASSGDGGRQPQVRLTPGYPMTVTPDGPLPDGWSGQDVRVTIVNAATSAAVLAVPVSAISTGADGQSSVTVVGVGQSRRRVPVTAGASADGNVEVTPTQPDALREGDTVVIGQAGS
ncbi:peptidoglycan-binding protein [Catenulispora subtropica]|uniref:Peptidoglycan binding-like domain-containing protein n=1 Tax=Catenulispora subtropica TaxID=450798 RepID=A0ABP5C3Z5_9ACTN